MKLQNTERKITTLLLSYLVIMTVAAGCGKTGGASMNPDTESGLANMENDNQSANYSSTDNANSATLSWSEPSHNADGTPLSGDLAGYIIYYGLGTDNYTESVDIGNYRSASINDLTSGTWCF